MPASILENEVQFQYLRAPVLKVPFSLLTKVVGQTYRFKKHGHTFSFGCNEAKRKIWLIPSEATSAKPGWITNAGSRMLYFNIALFLEQNGVNFDKLNEEIIPAKVKRLHGRRAVFIRLPREAFKKSKGVKKNVNSSNDTAKSSGSGVSGARSRASFSREVPRKKKAKRR